MTERRPRPRAAALLAIGAYALHQLRYALGYGHDAHERLGGEGHAYLTFVAPVLGLLAALLLADLGVRLLGARGAGAASPPRLRRLWALATAFLLLSYAAQELLEGMFAAGHPGGAAALTSGGGWVALPLAAALGLGLALLARGAHTAVRLAAEPPPRVLRAPAATTARLAARPRPAPIRLVDGSAAARGPPLAATAR